MVIRFLRRGALLATGFVFFASPASTQPPGGFSEPDLGNAGRVRIVSLQDETEPLPPPEEIPVLPETTVIATPFPAQPATDDTVLSASRTPITAKQNGSSVTVITREEIERRGSRNLDEILRTVPGVTVVQRGGLGQQSSLFLRGANSEQTKVLLDGIPINDPSSPNGAFNPAHFLLDNVERIEVLRGPQSTLYGSDAIGGVINITTKRGTGPGRLDISSSGGSYGTYNQTASLSGGDERYWYALSGSWIKSDGFSVASAGTERDGYENGTIGGRFGAVLDDDLSADVLFRYTDADADFDEFMADGLRNLDTETFFLRVQTLYSQCEGRIQHRTGYSFSSYKKDDARAAGFFAQRWFDGDSHKFDYQVSLLLIDEDEYSHTFIAGVEQLRERFRQDVSAAGIFFNENSVRFNNAVFIENQFQIGDNWFATAGYRHDRYSRSGHADTYRVTSRYLLSDETALHGAVGTGFRAPSLGQNAAGFGFNPNLQPEESFGWEFGIEQSFNDRQLVLDATYFRNDTDNLLFFMFTGVPPSFGTLINLSQASSHGIELTGRLELGPDTFVTAAYTHNETEDESTKTQLLLRPRNSAFVSLTQEFCDDQAAVSLGLRYAGVRQDFGGVRLDKYVVLDATGWYQLAENVRLFARVDNVADVDYQEAAGFRTPGLSAYGGFAIGLGAE
jgi:vitamin B12 transporter